MADNYPLMPKAVLTGATSVSLGRAVMCFDVPAQPYGSAHSAMLVVKNAGQVGSGDSPIMTNCTVVRPLPSTGILADADAGDIADFSGSVGHLGSLSSNSPDGLSRTILSSLPGAGSLEVGLVSSHDMVLGDGVITDQSASMYDASESYILLTWVWE